MTFPPPTLTVSDVAWSPWKQWSAQCSNSQVKTQKQRGLEEDPFPYFFYSLNWATHKYLSKRHWQDPGTMTPFLTPVLYLSCPWRSEKSHSFILPSLETFMLPSTKTKLQTVWLSFYLLKIRIFSKKTLKFLPFILVITGWKATSILFPLILDLDAWPYLNSLFE